VRLLESRCGYSQEVGAWRGTAIVTPGRALELSGGGEWSAGRFWTGM